MSQEAKLIELRGVSRVYHLGGETLRALDGVSVSINRGEFVAIVGPSGSGKSTLANVIGGLDQPSEGSVTIDDIDLSHAGDHKLSAYRNKYLGFVFQAFNLQPALTALENVEVPLILAGMKRRERVQRAKECLESVGLQERMNHRPAELSGGQRQRVSIARALANNPSLIIADEPTGNLDSQKGVEIMQLLRGLHKQGITLVIITHDESIAKQADRILSMHDGRLTESRK